MAVIVYLFVIVTFWAFALAEEFYQPAVDSDYTSDKNVDHQPYYLSYAVKDEKSYNDYGHEQTSDGNVVTGSYHVLLPDGRKQIVTYTADDYSGYVAHVKYEGVAKYSDFKPNYNSYDSEGYVNFEYTVPAPEGQGDPAGTVEGYGDPTYSDLNVGVSDDTDLPDEIADIYDVYPGFSAATTEVNGDPEYPAATFETFGDPAGAYPAHVEEVYGVSEYPASPAAREFGDLAFSVADTAPYQFPAHAKTLFTWFPF